MHLSKKLAIIQAVAVIVGIGATLQAAPSSDRIESAARKSYVYTTYLKNDDIKIQTSKDSVVTLTGSVAEWSHRSLAEETIVGLPGVVRVDNKLTIKEGQPLENSDGWINVRVKTMLLFHRNVSGLKTTVEVKDGIVTLRGTAANEAQKELSAEYAKDVDGVKEVKNELTLEKSEKSTVEKVSDFVDDASITAQVKLALAFHKSTNAMSTKVETKNGTVTVKGIAKNSSEKDLVTKLINDIKGVKVVKNEMTIS